MVFKRVSALQNHALGGAGTVTSRRTNWLLLTPIWVLAHREEILVALVGTGISPVPDRHRGAEPINEKNQEDELLPEGERPRMLEVVPAEESQEAQINRAHPINQIAQCVEIARREEAKAGDPTNHSARNLSAAMDRMEVETTAGEESHPVGGPLRPTARSLNPLRLVLLS